MSSPRREDKRTPGHRLLSHDQRVIHDGMSVSRGGVLVDELTHALAGTIDVGQALCRAYANRSRMRRCGDKRAGQCAELRVFRRGRFRLSTAGERSCVGDRRRRCPIESLPDRSPLKKRARRINRTGPDPTRVAEAFPAPLSLATTCAPSRPTCALPRAARSPAAAGRTRTAARRSRCASTTN